MIYFLKLKMDLEEIRKIMNENGKQTLKNFFEELWKNNEVLMIINNRSFTTKQLCPTILKDRITKEGENDIFKILNELVNVDSSVEGYMQTITFVYDFSHREFTL
jgi:hypothetical protein